MVSRLRKGVLLVLFVYFTFIGGTFYSDFSLILKVINWIVVSALLGGWLVNRLGRGKGLPATPLDGVIVAYLAAHVLSAALGLAPRYSFERLWIVFTHTLAFYLFVDLIRRGWEGALAEALYLSAAAVCVVGLAELASWYFGLSWLGFEQDWPSVGGWRQPFPPSIHRLNFTLNGATPLSAYLALLIPPALGLAATLPRRAQQRRALLFWLGLAFLIEGLTFSRSGILALLVSLPLLGLTWYATASGLRFSWSRWSIRRKLAIGGLALVAALGAGVWITHSLGRKIGSITFRLTLWESALRMVAEHPLTGVGPFNFGRALLLFNDANLPRAQITTAHSVYLNTAAEMGVLGLLTGGPLLALAVRAWWRRWKAASPQTLVRLGAAGAALAGLAAQTLVDTYMATPNILPMLLLVAFIVAPLPTAPRPKLRRGLSWLALGGLLIYVIVLGRWGLAEMHFELGKLQETQGNLPEAIAATQQARAIDPALTLYTFRLAHLEGQEAFATHDIGLAWRAIAHYEEGLAAEPVSGLNQANLAGLLWQVGEQQQAIAAMTSAAQTTGTARYWLNLGYFYEQANNRAAAIEAYAEATASNPGLADAHFWRAEPLRTGLWSEAAKIVVERADIQSNPGALLSLARSGVAEAQDLLPVDSPQLTGLYLDTGQRAQAAAMLDELYGNQCQSGVSCLLLGRLWLTEQPAKAERLLRTARFLGRRRANLYLGQIYETQGDLEQAKAFYERGFSGHVIDQNVNVALYNRRTGDDLLPQLIRTGTSERDAAAWLALASIYKAEGNLTAAQDVYALLKHDDPFFQIPIDP